MRLGTLKDQQTAVAVFEDGIIPLSRLGFQGSISDVIRAGSTLLDVLRTAAATQSKEPMPDASAFDAPFRDPGKLIAIGLNYVDHAAESQMELPKNPLVFTKFSSSITGPTDPVVIPKALTTEVDFEVELGVVIGKEAKNVDAASALDYVFGYTVINDVSARDLQFADKQWVRGKSLDTFCPMGPVVVTADEIADPQSLKLGCAVNGTAYQDDTTAHMIFGVAVLISELSKSFVLQPGDVIATGTPAGVGFSRKPPVYLRNGDAMRTWVDGIGELNNPIIEI